MHRGEAGPGGEEDLADFALLGEEFLPATHQGVVGDAIEGGKKRGVEPLQVGGETLRVEGIALFVEQVGDAAFTPLH